MKKLILFLILLFTLDLSAQVTRASLWEWVSAQIIKSRTGVTSVLPSATNAVNFGASGTIWNYGYFDTTVTNHLANTTWTLNSVAVTTTGTQLNYLAGATGTTGTTTTNLVFSTSPVLVTPTLGVAIGTSLALGGATIGTNALAVTGTSLLGGGVIAGVTTGLTNNTADGSDNSYLIVGGGGGFRAADGGAYIYLSGNERTSFRGQLEFGSGTGDGVSNIVLIKAGGSTGIILDPNADITMGTVALNASGISRHLYAGSGQFGNRITVGMPLTITNFAGTTKASIDSNGVLSATAGSFALGATSKLLLDGSTTGHTDTAGLLDINMSPTAAATGTVMADLALTSPAAGFGATTHYGINLSFTGDADDNASSIVQLIQFGFTPNTSPATVYGLYGNDADLDYFIFEDGGAPSRFDGNVTFNAGIFPRYLSGALTDGAPTDAEIDGITSSTPAGLGAGYMFLIKDTDGSGLIYEIISDGTTWQYKVLTIAL